jgi:hypothetical protein
MLTVGDKVVALLKSVENFRIFVQDMTVIGVEGTKVALRAADGTVVKVRQGNVFRSLTEAQEALRVEEALMLREQQRTKLAAQKARKERRKKRKHRRR